MNILECGQRGREGGACMVVSKMVPPGDKQGVRVVAPGDQMVIMVVPPGDKQGVRVVAPNGKMGSELKL